MKLTTDAAIAYRLVREAIANVNAVKLADETIVRDKVSILEEALHQHDKTMEFAEKALKINPKIDKAICEEQANLHQSVKDPDKRVSLAAIKQAYALNGLGVYDQAAQLLEAIALRTDGDEIYTRSIANLVDSYMGLSDPENASKNAYNWAARAEEIGDEHEEAAARSKLADILSELKKFAETRCVLKCALSLHTDEETRDSFQALLDEAELGLQTEVRNAK